MNVVDIINKAISERRTRFAFELLPPLKGDGCCGVFGSIDRLIGFDPAYINVTFHREGIKQAVINDGSVEWHVVRRRPGTVGISAAIQKKYDVEVVPHLICGGQSKYDIEDALIDLDFLGLHNVLALRGDKSQNEKFFMPHPQGHTHAVDLVRQIAAMNRGQFVDGEVEECHHSKFSIGVAGYPEVHAEARDITSDIARLRDFRFDRRSDLLGPIGIAVTQIAAGTQHNVVPDTCRFVADVRTTDAYTNEETVEILRRALRSEVTPRSTRIRASALNAAHPLARATAATGRESYVSPTTSDMALMPFPSLKMGPGQSSRSHTADEFVLLSEIEEGIGIYEKFIKQLAEIL